MRSILNTIVNTCRSVPIHAPRRQGQGHLQAHRLVARQRGRGPRLVVSFLGVKPKTTCPTQPCPSPAPACPADCTPPNAGMCCVPCSPTRRTRSHPSASSPSSTTPSMTTRTVRSPTTLSSRCSGSITCAAAASESLRSANCTQHVAPQDLSQSQCPRQVGGGQLVCRFGKGAVRDGWLGGGWTTRGVEGCSSGLVAEPGGAGRTRRDSKVLSILLSILRDATLNTSIPILSGR